VTSVFSLVWVGTNYALVMYVMYVMYGECEVFVMCDELTIFHVPFRS
jgi:hypothetical protein